MLNADERAALQRFIRAGGGWVGVHAASASERNWEWYEGLVGAIFDQHPAVQTGRIKVLDRAHPSTEHLPELWERTEEWYNWRSNPTSKVHTLAQIKVRDGVTGLDEGVDHPFSWCQNYDGGRSWFTAGGHDKAAFQEEGFVNHLLGGIRWAAGAAEGDCTATRTGSFQRTALATSDLADPFELAVAPDRRVFFAQRTGKLKVIDQVTMKVSTALDFAYTPEMTSQSDGLLGLTLDPGFAENNWLYLLHSDKVEKRLNLSRFTADGNTVDPASEKRLLTVPTLRGEGRANSHMAGSLTCDKDGYLYAATGDNTDPFASDGFTPIDEGEGRRARDAQMTAGNTNDLRGKILRITPQDDGTYTVPEGNLFAPGTERTRPEIYAMGMRNPFRITTDPRSGALMVADYGPDARAAVVDREADFGPEGALYVIDFGLGSGTGRGGSDEGSGIYRVDYVGEGRLPDAKLSVDRDSGPAPLTVNFSSEGSGLFLHGDQPLTHAWDFDGDGTTDSTEANPSHTYAAKRLHTARLTVTGPGGLTALAVQDITVGNTRPEVTIQQPRTEGCSASVTPFPSPSR